MHVHIKYSTETGSQSTKKEKEITNKKTHKWKGKLLSANGIILYKEKKFLPENLSKLINSSCYKIQTSIYKTLPFWYNKIAKKDIMNEIYSKKL